MSNLPAVNPTELGNALVAAKSRISMDAGDQPFLRLLKSGEWGEEESTFLPPIKTDILIWSCVYLFFTLVAFLLL